MAAKKKAGSKKTSGGKKSSGKPAKGGGGVKSKLDALKEKWNEGNENKLADFTGWEDGSYNTRLIKAHLNESKNGRLQVTFEFQDIDEEYDYNQFKHCGLDVENNEDCLRYLQKDMRVLGYDDINLNKLEGFLEELTEEQPEVGIQIKTKDDFKNCYINNKIED